jgi:AcrR family transcriptional regulator
MTTSDTVIAPSRGGRGARQRILDAATKLFYEEGIMNTGIERLTEVAEVSRRTLYNHFPSKTAIIDEYLRRVEIEGAPGEIALDRTDMEPKERLLAVFDDLPDGSPLRGCAFHNAGVEAANGLPTVRDAVVLHKTLFREKLVSTAQEAGASDPVALARQLSVLFEGARALTTSMNALDAHADARAAARVLIGAATHTPANEQG